MRNFLFVTDSGRRNEGLRNSQVRAENLEQAMRLFNIECADHHKRLVDASGRNVDGIFLITDSDSEAFIATIVDLGTI